MKTLRVGQFYSFLGKEKRHYPLTGQLELTYRCNLNCLHCYCKGSEDKQQELDLCRWKDIIDEVRKAGCLFLTFTGGEPLIREDFLELYSYAKNKGFIITVFSNGLLFEEKILSYFKRFPPYLIEITLNGISKNTYEKITQIEGSFKQAMAAIKELQKRKLPVIIKANCLNENKKEISKIKAFADKLLGKPCGRFHFKFDPMIYPRLNGDRSPCRHRLSSEALLQVKKQDRDIWKEYQNGLAARRLTNLRRDNKFLYHCSSWLQLFFVNPYGRLKFCQYSDKFSADLQIQPFKKSFYALFGRLQDERFKESSKCRDCQLRPICYRCPARAYLEVGNEEAPVKYYCQLAAEEQKAKKYATYN